MTVAGKGGDQWIMPSPWTVTFQYCTIDKYFGFSQVSIYCVRPVPSCRSNTTGHWLRAVKRVLPTTHLLPLPCPSADEIKSKNVNSFVCREPPCIHIAYVYYYLNLVSALRPPPAASLAPLCKLTSAPL